MEAHLLCRQKCHGCTRPATASPMVLMSGLLTRSFHNPQAPQAGEFKCPHTSVGPQGDEQCEVTTGTKSGRCKHRCKESQHPECTMRCTGDTFVPKEDELSCCSTPTNKETKTKSVLTTQHSRRCPCPRRCPPLPSPNPKRRPHNRAKPISYRTAASNVTEVSSPQ